VGGAHGHAAFAQARGDLEKAAGIAGDHYLGAGQGQAIQLAVQEFLGDLGVQEIVDSGAPAAKVRLPQRHQREPGDRPQETPRLRSDPLTVRQVAGVVIRHAQLHGVKRPLQPRFRQDLGNITDAAALRGGAGPKIRIVLQQLPVVLHHRPAAGGIDRHEIRPGCLEHLDRPPRQSLPVLPLPLMDK
jgi:hypothetical protein